MKLAVTLVLAMLPGMCFGMDRLSALSMLETGNDDTKVGRAGEISRYQTLKSEWKSVCRSTRYQDPALAKQVALKLIEQRVQKFQQVYRRNPTDFEFYALWNAPTQVLTGRISRVVAERANRFVNLCRSNVDGKITLAQGPRSTAAF